MCPTAQDIAQIQEQKGYVAVEDQVGGQWSADHLPPAVAEQLAPAAPLEATSDEDISLEPETFVYSQTGQFPPPANDQGGPFTLTVQAGRIGHNMLGEETVHVATLVPDFPLPSRRYTTPTLAERTKAQFDILRRQGMTVDQANAEAPKAGAEDIRQIKRGIMSSIDYRSGKIRRLEDIRKPQPEDAARAVGIMKALEGSGVNVVELLRLAGVKIAVEPKPVVPDPSDGFDKDALKRAPAPPMS